MSDNNNKKTTRTKMREQAFCLIYSYSFNRDTEGEALDEYYHTAITLNGYEDSAYLKTVFYGVAGEAGKLDAIISRYAIGWKIERISRVSLSLMRLCLYEAAHLDDVPSAVAINEAVELAKKYDTDEAPAFINGILNAAVKGEGLEK